MAEQPWWKTGAIYQIYVRSFADSNGDGIGDLPGIISKLDYLNDGTPNSLGVDAIWLTPFYNSPNRDFGYDVSDYRSVHPEHGTLDDFDELVQQAHKRGIKVILDFVPNHTSDQHPWFLESASSRDNPKRDWYVWADPRDGREPNNWTAAPGGKAWKFDPTTGQYFYHAFFDFQPDLNWRNPEVQQAVLGDIRFWLERGVDGFRLDLVNYLLEDESLRDNQRSLSGWYMGKLQDCRHTRDLPQTHGVLEQFRELTDAFDARMMVGEVVSFPWEDSPASSYTNSRELHLAFNMEFLAVARFGADRFRAVVDRFESRCPEDGWPAYVLSNHDVPRHIGRLGGYAIYNHRPHAFDRARVCAAMLLCLRGTPFMYYGEELGMTNRWWPRSAVRDPLGHLAWPLYQGRDASRTPMLWQPGAGAGFSAGEPWLPIDQQADELCVQSASADPNSLLSFYRRLIWLRKRTTALQSGDYQPLGDPRPGLFAFRRTTQDQSVLVTLNFSGKPQALDAPVDGRLLLSSAQRPEALKGAITLEPYEVLIIEE
ncbi:MAG: alpha-glucosidase [Candidatus Alcyoniella australis]|nr:alpha-glucosidase [Candidatus Alcyoniella australis]